MVKTRKISVILALLIIALIIVFFIVKEKINPYADLGPEVLLGSECGFDYLPCCKTSPACSFGQSCCADPNNSSESYCADDCSCGEINKFCCSDNVCNDDLACYLGRCEPFGLEGEICNPKDNSCNDDLVCFGGLCVECGLKGNPCCGDGEICQKSEEKRLECFAGLCDFCGFSGLRACPGDKPCLSGHLYNNNVCYLCGDVNQPCCDKKSEVSYDCNPAKNLVCELGFCKK